MSAFLAVVAKKVRYEDFLRTVRSLTSDFCVEPFIEHSFSFFAVRSASAALSAAPIDGPTDVVNAPIGDEAELWTVISSGHWATADSTNFSNSPTGIILREPTLI